MTTAQFIVLILLIILLACLMLVVLLRQGDLHRGMHRMDVTDELAHLGGQLEAGARQSAESSARLREEVRGELVRMQESNERRLDKMQGIVDEKLEKSLNERLDSNFKQVGDQLSKLYQSLGELQSLQGGVADLQKTLSNVKTRGVWGEAQLSAILEQTMTRAQYDTNVQVKRNSEERVEFAVKFPAQEEGGEPVYLPIDAKFPADIYNKVVDAASGGDPKALEDAQKELKTRIQGEARKIRDKYINPPKTTNYAILFLPTEGLYAEVLRMDGLSEQCQQMGVVLAGPTTVTAILNSLQVGFRNIMLSKKSVEVMNLLEAVKAQFGKMHAAIDDTQKKLAAAVSSTEELQRRTGIMERRMKKIGEMDEAAADALLAMDSEEVFLDVPEEDTGVD